MADSNRHVGDVIPLTAECFQTVQNVQVKVIVDGQVQWTATPAASVLLTITGPATATARILAHGTIQVDATYINVDGSVVASVAPYRVKVPAPSARVEMIAVRAG